MPFRDITGHRHIRSLLSRAVARGRLPPSVILDGPDGVGKSAMAQAVAEALNCEQPRRWSAGFEDEAAPAGIDGCGECATCRRIARGTYPDVVRIVPGDTGSIKIDAVRRAIELTGYRPFEGRRRVVIVDGADAMDAAPQNALLKTLEEPPSSSIFILVTACPDALLPTVRSRCPRLRFGPLSAADVAAVLAARGWSDAEAQATAAVAEGSPGRALDIQDGRYEAAREVAGRALAQAAHGSDPRRLLDRAKDLLPTGKKAAAREREELAARLRALGSLVRDLEVLSTRADERLLANRDLKDRLEPLLRSFDRERAVRAFTAVSRALSALERNASPKIVADWVVFQL